MRIERPLRAVHPTTIGRDLNSRMPIHSALISAPGLRTGENGRDRANGRSIRALSVDLDRTLGPAGRGPSPEGLEALLEARRIGLRVVVASGRTLPDLRRFFLGREIVDAFVAENGAIIYLPDAAIERTMGRAIGSLVRRRMRSNPPRPIVFGRVVASFPLSMRSWAERRLRGVHVDFVRNVDRFMVLPTGVTKARGVEQALRYWGFPDRAYAAIGDAENDVPMLEHAALSATVRNAVPAARRAASVHCRAAMGRGVLEFVTGALANYVSSYGPGRE